MMVARSLRSAEYERSLWRQAVARGSPLDGHLMIVLQPTRMVTSALGSLLTAVQMGP